MLFRSERELVAQDEARRLDDSMAIAWELLRTLLRAELTRLSDAQIGAHLDTGERSPDTDA